MDGDGDPELTRQNHFEVLAEFWIDVCCRPFKVGDWIARNELRLV